MRIIDIQGPARSVVLSVLLALFVYGCASSRPGHGSGVPFGRPINLPVVEATVRVSLVDGTELNGTIAGGGLVMKTSYADVEVPIDQLVFMQRGETPGRFTVELTSGDRLSGTISSGPFELKTILGDFEVNPEVVQQVMRELPELKIRIVGHGDWSVGSVSKGTGWRKKGGYAFRDFPARLDGTRFVVRPNAHGVPERKSLQVTAPCTLYVAVMWDYIGNILVTPNDFQRFANEGWDLLDDPFKTTSSRGEIWKWRLMKKDIPSGQLRVGQALRGLKTHPDMILMFKPLNSPAK